MAAASAAAATADDPKLVLMWETAVHHALEAYLQHQIPKGKQWMATAERTYSPPHRLNVSGLCR